MTLRNHGSTLLQLQNIFRTDIISLHNTITIANIDYPYELVHIFLDCLNMLYTIKTKIKHPTLHNNHYDKIILKEIVELLQQCTQHMSLYKVKAHTNIDGNEQTNKLAEEERSKEQQDASRPHELAHSTPYYYQRDWWQSIEETPNKELIRFLEKYLIKYHKQKNLEIIAIQIHNIDK